MRSQLPESRVLRSFEQDLAASRATDLFGTRGDPLFHFPSCCCALVPRESSKRSRVHENLPGLHVYFFPIPKFIKICGCFGVFRMPGGSAVSRSGS